MKGLSGARSCSSDLPASLLRRLNSYALAASAAGVSLLGLSPVSQAEIVYTPANTPIGPMNEAVPLDLNHDGIVDFMFEVGSSFGPSSTITFFLKVIPAQPGNNVWGHSSENGRGWASALPAGFLVDKEGQFYSARSRLMATSGFVTGARPLGAFYPGSCFGGGWGGTSDRYLALKFSIDGQAHFGWARLTVACTVPSVTATLTGYAYETVASRPTITGLEHYKQFPETSGAFISEPGTLGRLAQGAVGLAAWRNDYGDAARGSTQ